MASHPSSPEDGASLVDNAADIISRHRPDGSCLSVSGACRRVLGYEPEELLGHAALDLVHPDDLERLRALAEGSAPPDTTIEYRVRRKDGDWRWFETTLRTVRDDDDRPTEVIAVARDVTARKDAEGAALRSRAEIVRIYENMTDAFFALDRNWRMVYLNPIARQIRGGSGDDLLGKNIWELFPDLQGTKFETEYHRAMREGVAVQFEEYYPGMGRWFEVSAYPSDDGLSVHFRDVTERREIEEKIRLSEQRYAEAYETERAAAEHLRALDEMKQAFLSAVSHELRTPLTAVVGYAETLAGSQGRLPEGTRSEILDRLVVNAQRLRRRLGDLLDLDHLVASSFHPHRSPTEIGPLIERTVAASEVTDGRQVTVSSERVTLTVDPSLIERIVRNLLSNAARHTPPGTPVWVSLRAVEDGALIEVADAGDGVDPALASQIFEPFRHGAPTASPGVGIGLSLVARFTELHGGRAWVQQREGGGAAFRVFIPANDVPSLREGQTGTGRGAARRRTEPGEPDAR